MSAQNNKRTWRPILFRHTLTFLVLVGLLLFAVSSVSAETVGYTQTFRDVTETIPADNPCSGAAGVLTVTYNGLVHVSKTTSESNGETYNVVGIMSGTITFVPNDPAQPTYTGNFAVWFFDQDSNGTGTFDVVARLSSSDGTQINAHAEGQYTVTITGGMITGVGVSFQFGDLSC